MRRQIIKIDEAKCNGCGLCVPQCAEGAIAIVNGKAKLVRDSYCDGLGACLGHCPEAAITIEEREADGFDEARVAQLRSSKHWPPLGRAPLLRLVEKPAPEDCDSGGCPGSRAMALGSPPTQEDARAERELPSQLRQWPIQMHLVSPLAPQFREQHVVLAADCAAYAYADFHRRFISGHALAIACPKLDEGQDLYVEKLAALIDQATIASLTVVIMEVPCCMGLLRLAQEAVVLAKRKLPIHTVTIGVRGDIVKESVWAPAG